MAHEVSGRPAKHTEVERVLQHFEPKVVVDADTSQGGLQVDSERFTLTGAASDPAKLRDLYIFVNDQKVFFRTAGNKSVDKLDFTTSFSLKPGNNTVLVVAREDDELIGRKTLIIHRGDRELAQRSTSK